MTLARCVFMLFIASFEMFCVQYCKYTKDVFAPLVKRKLTSAFFSLHALEIVLWSVLVFYLKVKYLTSRYALTGGSVFL